MKIKWNIIECSEHGAWQMTLSKWYCINDHSTLKVHRSLTHILFCWIINSFIKYWGNGVLPFFIQRSKNDS